MSKLALERKHILKSLALVLFEREQKNCYKNNFFKNRYLKINTYSSSISNAALAISLCKTITWWIPYFNQVSLLNCAPYAPAPLRAFTLINKCLTRLCFVLHCVVTIEKVRYLCSLCVLQLTIHPRLSPLFYFTITVPFSLVALPRSSSLRICCCKIIVKIVVQPIA